MSASCTAYVLAVLPRPWLRNAGVSNFGSGAVRRNARLTSKLCHPHHAAGSNTPGDYGRCGCWTWSLRHPRYVR